MADIVLDVLGELGGGRGDPLNELSRFTLGMLMWGLLWVFAKNRSQLDSQPQEALLLIGVSLGFLRELLMFTVTSLQVYNIVSSVPLALFVPPFEQSLALTARVIVAAAFLQYLLRASPVSRRYLVIGLPIVLLFYVVSAVGWWVTARADSALRYIDSWSCWYVHVLGALFSATAMVFFLRTHGWLRNAVLAAFGMFLLDDILMLVNIATGEMHAQVFQPIRHNLHIWAIPILCYIYYRETQQAAKHLESKSRNTERLEALGQLSSGIAHDFNNHLQIILGFTEVAKANEECPASMERSLDNIEQAGERASSLVSQLLAFSRRQEPNYTHVDLNDVITGLTPMLSHLLSADLRIKHDLDSTARLIKADRRMIEQIIVNLVVNARDAMTDGGTIQLQTSTVLGSGDHVSTRDKIRLIVADTGAGMDATTVQHAFEPFFTTKPIGQGTGLGLATVYGIVQKHQGEISIDSEPGTHTRVVIDFPVAVDAADADVPVQDESVPGGSEIVLLAEDEYAIRDLITTLLSAAGYTVLVANDGQHAVNIASTYHEPIDLCLFDVAMPQMNGYQTHDAIRALGIEIPALFMTGDTNRATSRREDVTHMQKPFTRTALLTNVRNSLGIDKMSIDSKHDQHSM